MKIKYQIKINAKMFNLLLLNFKLYHSMFIEKHDNENRFQNT